MECIIYLTYIKSKKKKNGKQYVVVVKSSSTSFSLNIKVPFRYQWINNRSHSAK